MEELTEELLQVALDAIDEFGADIAYTAIETGGYNPATSSTQVVPAEPVPAKALVEDYNLQGSGQAYAAGLIKEGDKKFTVAGAAVSAIGGIEVGGKIDFDGGRYTALNVKQYYLGGTPILFEVQGRS
jgi:hypothetical protein